MKRIRFIKDYAFRADQIIETASTMQVGELRAAQLVNKEFAEYVGKGADGKEVKRHMKKARMQKKESPNQTVEHIIKNED